MLKKLMAAAPLFAFAVPAVAPVVAGAQEADFYRNKTVSIVVSTGVGGGYDTLARSVARYLPKYLPGTPSVIVQNMPGGGHMLAANYIYSVAPKDGTVLAILNQNVPSNQVLSTQGVRYDASKYIWLGRFAEKGNPALAIWHTAPIKTLADAKTTEVMIGATGEGSSSYRYTTAMNNVLGTKFKIIKGYKTVPELLVAMERGEIQGRTGALSAYQEKDPRWIAEGKLRFLVQVGFVRDPDLPNVPLWTELAETAEQKQILSLIASPTNLGRPVNTTPDVPANRVALLRAAMMSATQDPGFVAEADKLEIETDFRGHEETAEIVRQTVDVSPDVVAKAIEAMK